MENKHHANETLQILNGIGPSWAAQFDAPPEFHLSFTENDDGLVHVNGEPLCFIQTVGNPRVFIDADHFGFITDEGGVFRMDVDWPYGSNTARLIRISYHYTRELTGAAV